MAERRMFAKSVVLSDTFFEMSKEAVCLYYTLGMCADDDGFVNSPKSTMRQCNATEKAMLSLIENGFVIPFESGVVAIRHWKTNNRIQKDRYKPTCCTFEKSLIEVNENGVYSLSEIPCVRSGSETDTQYSEEKGRKEKDIITYTDTPSPSLEEIEEYCRVKKLCVNPKRFYDYYTKKEWHTSEGKPVDDWYSLAENWDKTQENKKGTKENLGSFETDDFFEAALKAARAQSFAPN